MNKNAVQKFAIWARNELITQVSQRAYQYGIDESGFGDASADTLNGRLLTAEEKSQRQELIGRIKDENMNKTTIITNVQTHLFELQDLKYRDFHAKLMPTVNKEKIIGVRTPALRVFAKKYGKTDEAKEYLQILPHQYYEENNLHGLLIEQIKDYDTCLEELERFLPYIDNWATCDIPRPKCFAKHKTELLPVIKEWIASGNTYTIRYGIGTLMSFYLDEDFKPEYIELVASVQSEEYYVNMMIAWYLATALAKQWDATIPYLEERKLSPWVHRKTIQKAVESYRITDEQKVYLKTLRENC